MSDQVLLWLVLTVVYGWECVVWLRRDSVAFVTWLGRSWRLRFPGAFLGNQRGGFVGLPPLPPLGMVFVAAASPISIAPEGVLGFVSASLAPGGRGAQSGAFFSFEDLSDIRVRNRGVWVKGRRLAETGSVAAAQSLADRLRALAQMSAAARPQEIQKQIRSMFNLGELKGAWETFQKKSRELRRCANGLFVFLFIIAPASVWLMGLGRVWIPLLVLLLGLTSAMAFLFHRLHREFYPELEDERFTHDILVLLSPATSVRATDTVSRSLFHRYHPLVVGRQFLPTEAFREFARRVLIELRHPALPVCPNAEPAAQAAEQYWRAALLTQCEKFMAREGMDPAQLLTPPAAPEPDCVAYCPHCRTQFTSLNARCADCGGMELEPLKPAAEPLRA